MSPASAHLFLTILFGFSVAGMLTSGYHAVLEKPPSYRLLGMGFGATPMRAMPFVTFAAPFLIMRNTVRARGVVRARFFSAMIATIVAGGWSLLSGQAVIVALRALGIVQI